MIKEIINFGVFLAKKILEILLSIIKLLLIKGFLFPLLIAIKVPALIMKILEKLKSLKIMTKIQELIMKILNKPNKRTSFKSLPQSLKTSLN
jgi:hypothetical protein